MYYLSPYGPHDKMMTVHRHCDGDPYCTLNNLLPLMHHPPCPLMLLKRKENATFTYVNIQKNTKKLLQNTLMKLVDFLENPR